MMAATMLPRPFVLLLSLMLVFAPVASNPFVAPVEAYGELDVILRLVPSVLGAVVGWQMGSPLGVVGKIIGGYVGLTVGKMVGRFLSHTIGGIFYDQYRPWAPSTTGITGPGSPVSSGDLGALRERWISSVSAYQDALKTGSEGAKKAARDTLEAAQAAYFSAKGSGAK